MPFTIQTTQESIKSPAVAPALQPVDLEKEREFHANVPDALFDYNKTVIRPDTQRALNYVGEYLAAHPDICVLLGGYADNRGSLEYNLVLGENAQRS